MIRDKLIFCTVLVLVFVVLISSLSLAKIKEFCPECDLPQGVPALVQPPPLPGAPPPFFAPPLQQPQSVLPSVVRETLKKITGEIWQTYRVMKINKMTPEQAVRAILKCEANYKNKNNQCYAFISDPEFNEQIKRCSDLVSGRDNLPYRDLNWRDSEERRKLNDTIDNCFEVLNLFQKRINGCFQEAVDEYARCYRDLGLKRTKRLYQT